jgi:hypothetical protein
VPDALATIDSDVHATALSHANHQLALDRVTLEDPSAGFSTELAVEPFTPFWIHADESTDITMANGGTTNAELAPVCGQTANLFVYLWYLDSVDGSKIAGTWTSAPVAIACP